MGDLIEFLSLTADHPAVRLAALFGALLFGYRWGHRRATKHAAKTLWMGIKLGGLVQRMDPGERRMVTVKRSDDGEQVELSWLRPAEEVESDHG